MKAIGPIAPSTLHSKFVWEVLLVSWAKPVRVTNLARNTNFSGVTQVTQSLSWPIRVHEPPLVTGGRYESVYAPSQHLIQQLQAFPESRSTKGPRNTLFIARHTV